MLQQQTKIFEREGGGRGGEESRPMGKKKGKAICNAFRKFSVYVIFSPPKFLYQNLCSQ